MGTADRVIPKGGGYCRLIERPLQEGKMLLMQMIEAACGDSTLTFVVLIGHTDQTGVSGRDNDKFSLG